MSGGTEWEDVDNVLYVSVLTGFGIPSRWMYWTDWEEDPTESNRGKIKKAWMDGSHHQVFLTSKTVLWPNGLSLDIPQGILYWVDAYYDRIELVYLNTTERKVRNQQGFDRSYDGIISKTLKPQIGYGGPGNSASCDVTKGAATSANTLSSFLQDQL